MLLHTKLTCMYSITEPLNTSLCTAPCSCPPSLPSLLPAVVSLVVVVLLLITCVALLALALAVTATKLNKLRAEKAHTDYNQTGGGEGRSTERIYDEVGEGTDPIGGQKGHYQELKLETMDKKQYETCIEDTR